MSIKSKFFLKWGNNLIRDGSPDLAIGMFDKAIKADPYDVKSYIAKSGTLLRLRRPEEARQTLDKAIYLNPESAEVLNDIRSEVIKLINEINNLQ